MRPQDLEQVLRPLRLANPNDDRIVAGAGVPDDAVVVRTPSGQLLVQTVDFFTPITDDPELFGQIAAANSLSDVYAMGGEPLSAMNICCFPLGTLPPAVLSAILCGGAEKVREAGAVLAGGHTVVDAEPKYGLAVTGLVEPEELTTKGGGRPGDLLLLTKPLGTGVLTTAIKKGRSSEAEAAEAFRGMARLNREAAVAMRGAKVRHATDITGYGLLGHAWEMVRHEAVRFCIEASEVPLYEGAEAAARAGLFPGGSKANAAWLESVGAVEWSPEVSAELRGLLNDAQTSGGLLLVWPPEVAVPDGFWRIGRVEAADPKGSVRLSVLP